LTGTKSLEARTNKETRITQTIAHPQGVAYHSGTLSKARLEMIAAGARLCQILGLPKSTGQIYGLLFLATNPLALVQIAESLGISKGSASTGTRQLLSFRIVRQVWVQGERRDYYEVDPDVGAILRIAYAEFVKPKLKASNQKLQSILASLEHDLKEGQVSREEYKVCRNRLSQFTAMQSKIDALIPLAEKLL
jgi:DNA-binding transcriptional regulator GbsR (MarR family)